MYLLHPTAQSSSPDTARVVSAEFEERRRAGNGVRHVIVAAVGMRDGVPANRAGATLKPNDLALKRSLRGRTMRLKAEGTLRCLVMRGDKCDENPSPENVLSLSPPMVIVLIDKPF